MMLFPFTSIPSFSTSTSRAEPVRRLDQLGGGPGVEPEGVDDEEGADLARHRLAAPVEVGEEEGHRRLRRRRPT